MNRQSIAALVIAAGMAWSTLAAAQEAFPTPEKAVESFVAALGEGKPDEARLALLLGDDWRTYIPRGGVQRSDVDTFLAQYRAQHSIDMSGANKAILAVGSDHWTLPIPCLLYTSPSPRD